MKAAASPALSDRERAVVPILLGAATLLRVPYALGYRVNSDEPQHLHVVWGWTRGLLQYRDFADNHPPLFHALMAPVLALVGERPDALALMRLAMIPLALAAIWLTYVLAARLWGRRAGVWSAVLLACHYEFFFKSLEFRTDNLWTVGWLAALALLAGGPTSAGRAALAGAALGADACVSQKTVLLAVALAAAAAIVVAVSPDARRALRAPRLARLAFSALAGMAAAPLAVAAYFAARGALPALAGAVLTQNVVGGIGNWGQTWRPVFLPIGLTAAIAVARPALVSAGPDALKVRRVALALVAFLYVLFLETVWPLVTGQDYLPVFPLAAVFAAVGLEAWRRRGPGAGPAVALGSVLALEWGVLVLKGPVWRDHAAPERALVADALALTGRDDPVLDTKGETVFRRRAFFPVLETITIERLRRGLLPDTVAEDAVRARCYVAAPDSARFPARGRAFLGRNFVSVGALRVAGRLLPGPSSEFEVAVPGPYAVVTARGAATGALDGTVYAGPRELAAGAHEFVAPAGSPPSALVWARAVELGFSPFHERAGTP